jgi:mannosyltransferase OCH1-like enzyme
MPPLVPRVFHQIWVGPKPLPDEFRAYQETWRRHHPAWKLRLWTEDDLPSDLRRPEARDRLRAASERSDILRLELLWRYGGVYIDTDFECVRPIDPLIDGLDFFTAEIGLGRINNAFIGSVAGHEILERALDEMRPREFYGADKASAGPEFLDPLLHDYPAITVFPARLFYPSTEEMRKDAVAVHHAARTWVDEAGLRVRLAKAERRAEKAKRQLARAQQDLRRARRDRSLPIRALRFLRSLRDRG